jgi:sugar phosphate isomerase/epimerase
MSAAFAERADRTTSRRLSCVDAAFPRLSHHAALGVIRDLEIPAADISVFLEGPHTSAESVAADPGATADAVLRRIELRGLEVADVFLILGLDDLAVNNPDRDLRTKSSLYFRRTVEFASRLGAPGITVLPGATFDGVDPGESLDLAASELEWRALLAAEAGLRLSFEPHVGSIAESPDSALDLLQRATHLELTLDHSHFIYQGIPQDELDELARRSRHVQIRQASLGLMQAPATKGGLHLDRLREQLDAAGYDRFIALEYLHDEWLDCDRLDCLSETAELRDLLFAHGVAGSAREERT